MKSELRRQIYNKLETPKIVLDLASKGRHLSKKSVCRALSNLNEVLAVLKNQKEKIIVSAWNNGTHYPAHAAYGIKVKRKDRDKHFNRKWKSVLLKLRGKGGYVTVNLDKKSFWDPHCRELVSKDIGVWLKKNRQIPWMKSCPPRMLMEHVKGNKFRIRLIK